MRKLTEILNDITNVNNKLAQEYLEAAEHLYTIDKITFSSHSSSGPEGRKTDLTIVSNITTSPKS